MKTILVLGSTGKIGQLLTQQLIDKKYPVVTLVRNPDKLNQNSKNLKVIKGDPTNTSDLRSALKDIDIVVSVLGHGFRTQFPIQKNTMQSLVPLMEEMDISRLITITGSDLLIEGDEYPLYAKLQRQLFSLVDPYRMADAVDQQKILEKSNLDWTVIRTPVHSSGKKIRFEVTVKKPFLWQTISRKTVVEFITKCIEEASYYKKSPIIV